MPPAYQKTILCLANSRKLSGRCFAGREFANGVLGAWIRPISGRPTAEISEDERRFENGEFPRVLDIVRIPMKRPEPHAFQVENHVIDDQYYWVKVGTATWDDAKSAVDGGNKPLWSNLNSSYNGTLDRVAEDAAQPADGSLRLIKVRDLDIRVVVEGAEFGNGKRKVRAQFTHNGTRHLLAVTDPRTENSYLKGQDGNFAVGRALLCISLGEPYQGNAYKLVAAVILKP